MAQPPREPVAEAEFQLPADGARIRRITVEGTSTLNPALITGAMELKEGDRFTREAYRNDLQAIASTGRVDPLAVAITWEPVEDGSIDLVVRVKENPTIASIQIVGNSVYSQAQILAELDFKQGDVAPTTLVASTTRNLRSFYRNGGYKDARIRVELVPLADPSQGADVLITIDEGKRIKIRDVELRGNTHLTPFFAKMKLTNAPGILFFNNYFDELALDDDLAILRGLYRDDGFLDARVRKGGFRYDEEQLEVVVVFEIEEGPRYTVGSVRAEGVTLFTPEEVKSITDELPGRLFSGQRLSRVVDGLRRLYGDQGYIDTRITYRFEKNAETAMVDIVFEVRESPVFYVGEVRIEMEEFDYDIDLSAFDRFVDWIAPPTKPATVERELRLERGAKYRTADEARTIERLRNLGIFKSVEILRRDPARQDPNRNEKDAIVVVKEDPAAAFLAVTAGVGEVSGPAVTLQVTQPNWGGNADRASASATFGDRNQAYRLRYFNRYLGESDNSLDTNLYQTSDRYRAYRERTIGGSTELGTPVGEYTTAYWMARYERVDFSGYDRSTVTDMDGYPVIAGRALLVEDRRDFRRWPTRGYSVSGGVEGGHADALFLKLLHGYEWYYRIGRSDYIYAYEHTVGLMPHESDRVGLSERFFVGGSRTLRGFRVREVGDRDPGNDRLAVGGATRVTQRHELRYTFNDFLKGRLFADAAILEQGIVELGRPRVGAGAGIIMDFGPLVVEVDLANPVIKESRDRAQYFHLRIRSGY